MNTWQH